jgi:predicted acyl esterase
MKVRQDRTTGDYNDFWAGRDQLNQLAKVKAATLMAHAFNDWNVVPEHSVRIAEALKGKVPLQQYYHQGGHGGAPPLGLRNRWFSRYLYGVQNGVENDPKAWVTREAAACPPRTTAVVGTQSNTATLTVASTSQLQVGMTLTIPQTNAAGTTTNVTRPILAITDATTVVLDSAVATAAGDRVADGATVSIVCSTANPTPYGDYPNPGSKAVEFRPQPGGNTTGALTPFKGPAAGAEKLVDDVSCQPGNFVNAGAQRLLYSTPTLTAPVHLSGTPKVKVRMAASKAAANLSVWLVALPFTPTVACTATAINTTHVITRGWADPQNRGAISGGAPLVPGELVDVAFDLQPTDKVVLAGQQLALMVFSSDRLFTLRPQPGTEVTVDLAGTSLSLPVVGGSKAYVTATGGDEEEAPVGGTVPATLSLTLGTPASFGAFTPGVAKEYTASTPATVVSTAGDATLSVADNGPNPGYLTNGAFKLPQPLQGLGVVKTWTAPTSNEVVPVTFKQPIGANDALRTGSYSKTLTFTLSTTNP